MHVIFVEPFFPANQREFVRALRKVGARVSAIGETPAGSFDPELRGWLSHYEQVPSVVHEGSLAAAVERIQAMAWVDRLECSVEAHVLPVAKVREARGIPGTSVRTAFLCRDKPAMKEVLRRAGVACAASIGTDDPDEVRAFARGIGYPLILKPRDAAGASGTYRADDNSQLEHVFQQVGLGGGASVAVEEFIEGHEAFYDTLTLNGEVVHDFITHYFPGVLEAMRTRWISPQFITTNRVDSVADYAEVKEMGRKVIGELGIGTSPTHMEWFFGPKGLKFSEIGCRPPGVRAWDLYAASNEFDIYEEWASLLVHGRPARPASRRYAAGLIALRPDRDGVIAGYEGLEVVDREFGGWILDVHLPPEGTPTQPVDAGYMANAWIRMKHPDYDELRRMLDGVGEVVQVRAR